MWALGRKTLGLAFLATYIGGALLFFVMLGYILGNFGYGLMVGAHASSLLFLQSRWLRNQCRFGFRLAIAIVTLLVLWRIIYAPFIELARTHWWMPLQVRGHVVIVQRSVSVDAIRRGDVVAYSAGESSRGTAHGVGGAVYVQAGLGCAEVLAVGGDRVKFLSDGFEVNGRKQPLLADMPQSGELIVPEKHWFIWPQFDINFRGNASPGAITATKLGMATVAQDQFLAKPYRHWFGRR